MIFHSITLHNFMSYADASLDLTSVKVACLTGVNGAGKSALLDAITWALWEQARSSSDELIRLGEHEMWVDISFRMGELVYRVRRSRRMTGTRGGQRRTSKGTLDFQVWSGQSPDPPIVGETDSGHWKSLTAPSMRQTQGSIIELLKMDYRTFINSAYLRQGKADEFTTCHPSERKQVLGNILGLGYFDQLQERARSEVRELTSRIDLIEAELRVGADLESRLQSTVKELDVATHQLMEVDSDVQSLTRSLSTLSHHMQDLRIVEERIQSESRRLERLHNTISSLESRLGELAAEQRKVNLLLDRAYEIEQQNQQFEGLKGTLERLDLTAMAHQELSQQEMELKSTLNHLRSRLEIDCEHQESELAELLAKQTGLIKATSHQDKCEQAYRLYKQLLAREAELSKKQESFLQLKARMAELAGRVIEARIHLEAQLGQKQSTKEEIERLLGTESALEAERETLYREVEELDKLEAELDLIEQKGLQVKSRLSEAEIETKELDRKTIELQHKISELTEHAHSSICPLCSAQIVDRSAVIERYNSNIHMLSNEHKHLQESSSEWERERLDLRQRYRELQGRLAQRKSLDIRIGQHNEKLAALERARLSLESVTEEIDKLKFRLNQEDYAQVERESLINLKTEMRTLEFDEVLYAHLQAQIRKQRHAELQHQQLQRDLQELLILKEQTPRRQKQLAGLKEDLSNGNFASEFRQQLAAIQNKLADLSYDRVEHHRQRQALSTLLPSCEQFRELERARNESPHLEESLTSTTRELKAAREEFRQLELDIGGWHKDLSKRESIMLEIERTEPLLTELCNKKDALSKEVAVKDSRRQELLTGIDTVDKNRKELESLKGQRDDFTYLSEVFGKRGIQAIIIENVVPEIENDANLVLSRLTDNRMHVGLVTQEKTKQGNLLETLELVIGDELGTRNYELYSGGEAFKIDFALRIALSRLLARRAGARLESLIIDEGFGSQDDQSRHRLVKTIASIRPDFAQILVITHMSDVRDMFPTQIQITKSGGVSTVASLS